MQRRREDGAAWEDIIACNGYAIDRGSGNVDPVRFGSKDLGFIVTEKSGLRVLHTATIAFFDVDSETSESRCKVLQHLYRFVGENPEYGFRVYRTAAGLRYLCTSAFFDPSGDESQEIMKRLRADSRYSMLCLLSQHFAARLNPKPERRRGVRDYAVTAYQFTVGNPVVLPECLHVLKMHDKETGRLFRPAARMKTYTIQLTDTEATILNSVLAGTGVKPEAWLSEAAVSALDSATCDESYREQIRDGARDRMSLVHSYRADCWRGTRHRTAHTRAGCPVGLIRGEQGAGVRAAEDGERSALLEMIAIRVQPV